MSDKNERRRDFIRYAILGTLGGLVARTAPEVADRMQKLVSDRQKPVSMNTYLVGKRPDDDGRKSASGDLTRSFIPPSMKRWMEDAIWKYGGGLALASAAYAGADKWFTRGRKEDLSSQLSDLKRHFYSKVLEEHESGKKDHYDAEERREKVGPSLEKQGSAAQLLFASMVLGVPLSAAYLTKKHLDRESQAWRKPKATEWYRQFDNSIARVKRVDGVGKTLPGDEDPDMKKKSSQNQADFEGYLNTQKAAEAHLLLSLVTGDVERSERSGLEDLINAASEGRFEEIKQASVKGLDALLSLPMSKEASTHSATRSLGMAFLTHEPSIRGVLYPYLCAEYNDMAPTFCKAASELDPEVGEFLVMGAILENGIHTQTLMSKVAEELMQKLSEDEITEVICTPPSEFADENLAQTIEEVFNNKEASDDTELNVLRGALYAKT